MKFIKNSQNAALLSHEITECDNLYDTTALMSKNTVNLALERTEIPRRFPRKCRLLLVEVMFCKACRERVGVKNLPYQYKYLMNAKYAFTKHKFSGLYSFQ